MDVNIAPGDVDLDPLEHGVKKASIESIPRALAVGSGVE